MRRSKGVTEPLKTSPSSKDPYKVAYFKRHENDDPAESEPGKEFLDGCPASVKAKFRAVIIAVATAPPPRFAGGGYWETMHDEMAGYHEIRIDGPKRSHYRLFCKLDAHAEGEGPLLTILCGAWKPFRTEFPPTLYEKVRAVGDEYLSRNPRSII